MPFCLTMLATLLIVDDEKHTRDGLSQAFEDDFDVYVAASADEAFNLFQAEQFDVILTDLKLGGTSGMKVIDAALKLPNRPTVVMMTAYGSVETAVDAMKRGAFDFLTKPVNLEKLEILLKRAVKTRNLEQENVQLHARLDTKFNFSEIIGSSEELQRAIERVKLVAPSRATVLLAGETGTGKELFAQAIHQNSDRARGPFVPVHAAALPRELLESELFGHERGAFTGATERRIGRFESADGGTLFLDEIGEIDAATQVKLLRFLETRTFERLGGQKPITVDVRLVVATNRDLEEMSKNGDFREDLFFRLNVVEIELPPLRRRPSDIPALLKHFIDRFSGEYGLPPVELTAEAAKVLSAYSWPGNIRELRNFAENVVVLHRGGRVNEYDLDPKYRHTTAIHINEETEGVVDIETSPGADGNALNLPGDSRMSVRENERRLLYEALKKADGNRTRAAELMGISRRTLHRKLAQWPELDPRRLK